MTLRRLIVKMYMDAKYLSVPLRFLCCNLVKGYRESYLD